MRSKPTCLDQCMFNAYDDNMHLPMGIYPSCDGSRILRVRGYMEMCSTCNLVDVQMMHGIYINDRCPDAHHNVYDIHCLL